MALKPVNDMLELINVSPGDTVLKSDLAAQNFLDDILNSVAWKEYDANTMVFLGTNSLESGAFRNITGIFGDLLVANRVPQFSANFSYPLDTRNNNAFLVGSGVVDYNVNKLRVRSGITISSKATVRSKRFLRYTSGRDAEMMFTAIFTAGVVGTFQCAGLFDDEDGFMIGFKDDKFSVIRRFDGQPDEVINQENFNGDKLDGNGISKFLLDPTKINIYRITYGYLGTAPIQFQISLPDGATNNKWVTFHQIDRRNLVTDTSVRIPYLPLSVEVDNGLTTNDIVIQSGSVYAGTFDGTGVDRAARYFAASSTPVAISIGIDERVIVFHNKENFNGIENHIEAMLLKLTGAVEGNKPVKLEIYKLPDQTNGAGTWAAVDINNSVMEASEDVVIVQTNKRLVYSATLSKSDSFRDDVESLFINLLPGEYAGVLATTTAVTDVVASFHWKELF